MSMSNQENSKSPYESGSLREDYKGPETGGKASSVKLEFWKPDYSRARHIVKANAKSDPLQLDADRLQLDALHVSCDITRLVYDLGLSRQFELEDRPQAVMSFTVTAEQGYYLLSVYVEWTDRAALPKGRTSRHELTHLRDTFVELYKAAVLCYAKQVLEKTHGICLDTQGHMVMVRFFAIPGFIERFLRYVMKGALGLTEVFHLDEDGSLKFLGLEGWWKDFRALAKKLADSTAGHGLQRCLHGQQTKPKGAKGQGRQISLEGLSQLSQLLTLEPSLTQQDRRRCVAMMVQGTGSEQHAIHNGTLVLVHAEILGGEALLGRALHSGTHLTLDPNFVHTKCESILYFLPEANAVKQFPELKDKVVVPVKNKKKRFEDMWNKMSPEEEVTVQVQDFDISHEKQVTLRRCQLAVWNSENFVRIARDAFHLRRQEGGNQPWDRQWWVSKEVRQAWMKWARNKLDSERSVASASVLRVDQLPSASDLPEEFDGPEGPDGFDSPACLEAADRQPAAYASQVFHSGERVRLNLTPERARDLGYGGGMVRVKQCQGDMVYVGLPEGDAWVNVNEVVQERRLQVTEAASSSDGGSGSGPKGQDLARLWGPPFLHRRGTNSRKGAWLGA